MAEFMVLAFLSKILLQIILLFIENSNLNSDISFWLKNWQRISWLRIHFRCNVPHEASVYFDQDCFDDLSSDLITLSSKHDTPICIAGDFNMQELVT